MAGELDLRHCASNLMEIQAKAICLRRGDRGKRLPHLAWIDRDEPLVRGPWNFFVACIVQSAVTPVNMVI